MHPLGESTEPPVKVRFDRRVQFEFRGATINSDARLLSARELDEALGLTEMGTGNARHCGGPTSSPIPPAPPAYSKTASRSPREPLNNSAQAWMGRVVPFFGDVQASL